MFLALSRDGCLGDSLSLCGNEMTVDRIPFGCLLFPKALLLISALPVLAFFRDEGEGAIMASRHPDQKPALEVEVRRDLSSTPSS